MCVNSIMVRYRFSYRFSHKDNADKVEYMVEKLICIYIYIYILCQWMQAPAFKSEQKF